ncbi:efflux RND transporter permease subunit [bacterium]|nr:efflux RND transporter permease subunit [bacterium]
MSIPSFSVKRPVTVTMIFVSIMLLGAISWFKLPQDLFPSISYPQLTIATIYENASPEEIETMITSVIEEGVGILPGIKSIKSVSKEGVSLVFLKFHWGTDMNFAALNAREKIDVIKYKLPEEAEEPLVLKYNPFELPVVIVSVSSAMDQADLEEVVRNIIKPALEKVEGVASVDMSGGVSKQVLVETIPASLSSKNISILDVINTLEANNLNYPAGSIEDNKFEYVLRTIGKFQTIEDIENAVVVRPNNNSNNQESFFDLVKIKDIADVKFTLKDRTSYSRYNGNENIALSIQRQSEVNIIKLAKIIEKRLKYIENIVPANVKIKIIYNQSEFISNAIKGMTSAAVMGGVLAFLVLFIFLHNVVSALIVAMCIPVCVMFTLILVFFKGISLNIMSLGGIALGIGMIVDNGIVVIENIHSKRGHSSTAGRGVSPLAGSTQVVKETIIKGTEEVFGAITSSTLTSIAVFFPMIFVSGLAGQLFDDFAFSVTFSQIASLIITVLFIPRMVLFQSENVDFSLEFLSRLKSELKMRADKFSVYFEKLVDSYEVSLNKFLVKKSRNLIIIFAVFSLCLLGAMFKEKLVMP